MEQLTNYCNDHQQPEPCPVCAEDKAEPPPRAVRSSRAPIGEREFWIVVRGALLTIVSAIEMRWGIGKNRSN